MLKKTIIFIITAVVLGVGLYFIKNWPNFSAKDIVVNNFIDCLDANYAVVESYPRKCTTPAGRTFVEDIGNQINKYDLVRLTNIQANQKISTPLLIKGEARGSWYFEASFPVQVLDANKAVIGTGIARAQVDWMTENFVPFEAWINFDLPKDKRGYLVLKKDNPSGEAQFDDQLMIPIIFDQDKMTVKLFFTTPKTAGADDFACQYVEAVNRQVPKSESIARAALLALLRGPNLVEKNQAYGTVINNNVQINDLKIEDGVAMVDFDSRLQDSLGGSCRVSIIRAQIEQTLKQFPTIQSVQISVNGDTEQALQP